MSTGIILCILIIGISMRSSQNRVGNGISVYFVIKALYFFSQAVVILILSVFYVLISKLKDAQTRVNLVFALPEEARAIFKAAKAKVT